MRDGWWSAGADLNNGLPRSFGLQGGRGAYRTTLQRTFRSKATELGSEFERRR